jgi:hypothetical protein
MKLRAGFISNSSTCSFVMCGYKIPEEDSYQSIIQKVLGITSEEIVKEIRNKYSSQENITQNFIEDFCSDWVYDINYEKNGVDIQTGEGINGIIVGIKIAHTSTEDCGIEEKEINLLELQKQIDIIRIRLNIDSPAKIYAGTYSC